MPIINQKMKQKKTPPQKQPKNTKNLPNKSLYRGIK